MLSNSWCSGATTDQQEQPRGVDIIYVVEQPHASQLSPS